MAGWFVFVRRFEVFLLVFSSSLVNFDCTPSCRLSILRAKKKFSRFFVFWLFPKLFVVVTTLCLAHYSPTLSPAEYFTNPQTYKYLLNGALIMVHQFARVFTNNPSGDMVNAALWTLRLSLFATFNVLSAINSPSLIRRNFCCSRYLFLRWR